MARIPPTHSDSIIAMDYYVVWRAQIKKKFLKVKLVLLSDTYLIIISDGPLPNPSYSDYIVNLKSGRCGHVTIKSFPTLKEGQGQFVSFLRGFKFSP